jgi:hypothetical protein
LIIPNGVLLTGPGTFAQLHENLGSFIRKWYRICHLGVGFPAKPGI